METFPQVIKVRDQQEGLNCARDILYKKSDNQTLLLLSGGSTPKDLYETLAKEKILKAKALGMVDERIDRSNYKMIKSTGLLDYFENLRINFYPMISFNAYDKKIRDLIKSSKNKIAIMGIGEDGHTAGLPAGIPHFAKASRGEQNSKFKIQNYVTDIGNFPGEFKKRITLTFRALSEMDLFIVMVFGGGKEEALRAMFKKGPIEEIPARFYARKDIAKKTILITDQKI